MCRLVLLSAHTQAPCHWLSSATPSISNPSTPMACLRKWLRCSATHILGKVQSMLDYFSLLTTSRQPLKRRKRRIHKRETENADETKAPLGHVRCRRLSPPPLRDSRQRPPDTPRSTSNTTNTVLSISQWEKSPQTKTLMLLAMNCSQRNFGSTTLYITIHRRRRRLRCLGRRMDPFSD